MAGQNPQGGGGDQTDRGDAARLHDDFSSFGNGRRRAAAQQVPRDIHEHRNHGLRPEIRIERPPPPDAVGDDHQHVDRALDVRVLGDVAALGGGVEHVREPFPDVGIEAAEMRAISGLRRASDMTSVHSFTCSIERTVKW